MPMMFAGFKRHPELEGRHAVFGASTYHWLNYDDAKLLDRYANHKMAQRGTELHVLAHDAIRLGVKFGRSQQTIPMYVNDCLGHRMSNEVVLYYSPLFYGSADAIKFEPSNKPSVRPLLRIFDLKTGVNPASPKQLIVYAALFCLEYGQKPFELDYDLRIYQNDEKLPIEVDPQDIADAMERIESGTALILSQEEV